MSASLADDLLLAGVDDWVHFADVWWLASQAEGRGSRDGRIDAAVTAIRALQERGLIRVGDVGPGGFVAWQTSIDESADRIRRDWMALGRDPVPGDIGWIANTEEGDRAARALKKQDQ